MKMSFLAGQDYRVFNALLVLFILMFKLSITIFNFGKSVRVVTSKSVFMSNDNFIVVHLNKIISSFFKSVHY